MLSKDKARELFKIEASKFINIPDFSKGVDIIEWRARDFMLSAPKEVPLPFKGLFVMFKNPKLNHVQQTTCFHPGDDLSILNMSVLLEERLKLYLADLGNKSILDLGFSFNNYRLFQIKDFYRRLGSFEPFVLQE